MGHILRFSSLTLLISFLLAAPGVHAEKTVEVEIPENSVLSDGVIDKNEMAHYLVIANKQLSYLAERATEEYQKKLEQETATMPSGWMLMKDGVTVKELKLDESAEGAPPQARVLMFRAALKSIARRGQINAAAILYAGQMSNENPQRILVIEHEHRLGISGSKLIPFEKQGKNISYLQSVTREKPFQMFYDDKSAAPGNSG